jgi:hypothetical protein
MVVVAFGKICSACAIDVVGPCPLASRKTGIFIVVRRFEIVSEIFDVLAVPFAYVAGIDARKS